MTDLTDTARVVRVCSTESTVDPTTTEVAHRLQIRIVAGRSPIESDLMALPARARTSRIMFLANLALEMLASQQAAIRAGAQSPIAGPGQGSLVAFGRSAPSNDSELRDADLQSVIGNLG